MASQTGTRLCAYQKATGCVPQRQIDELCLAEPSLQEAGRRPGYVLGRISKQDSSLRPSPHLAPLCPTMSGLLAGALEDEVEFVPLGMLVN